MGQDLTGFDEDNELLSNIQAHDFVENPVESRISDTTVVSGKEKGFTVYRISRKCDRRKTAKNSLYHRAIKLTILIE